MMTVEIVKRMKVKKIDLDKADVVKWEVCSRDEVMHVGKNEKNEKNGFLASPGFGARARNEASTTKTETTGGLMGGQSDYGL